MSVGPRRRDWRFGGQLRVRRITGNGSSRCPAQDKRCLATGWSGSTSGSLSLSHRCAPDIHIVEGSREDIGGMSRLGAHRPDQSGRRGRSLDLGLFGHFVRKLSDYDAWTRPRKYSTRLTLTW